MLKEAVMLKGTLQYPHYKNSRLLTQKEKELRLSKKRIGNDYVSHGSNFIKMNSTYLESINGSFFLKGNAYLNFLFGAIVVIPIILIFSLILLYSLVVKDGENFFGYLIVFSPLHILLGSIVFIFYKAFNNLKKYEIKGFNYYPIRFNRKNKKVYVYDVSGEVFEGDWDKIDFILNSRLGGCEGIFWEVKAFIKDENEMIQYTFAFALGKTKKDETLEIWEFIKTYMISGPINLYYNKNASDIIGRLPKNKLSYCLDVEKLPESLELSKQIVALDYQSEIKSFYSRGMIQILGYCRNKFITFDKQPKWPQSVEDECQVEKDDKYIVNASTTYQLDTYCRVIKS